MSTAFRIPIAYPQPTPGLSFHQSLDSLVSLNTTINDIFHKLNARVLSERSRLDNIGTRIAAAEQKVQSFQRNQNSLLVASPVHFPVESLKPVEPLFPETAPPLSHARHIVQDEQPAPFVIERVEDLLADQLSCKIDDDVPQPLKKHRSVRDVSNLVLFGAPKKSRRTRVRKIIVREQDPEFEDIVPETDPAVGKYIPDIHGLPDARSSLPTHLGGVLKNIAANVAYAPVPKPQQFSPLAVYDVELEPTVSDLVVAQPTSQPAKVEGQPPLPTGVSSDKGKEEQMRSPVPPVVEAPKTVHLLPPPISKPNPALNPDEPMKRGTPPPLPGQGQVPKPAASSQKPASAQPTNRPPVADEPMRRGTPPPLPSTPADAPMRRGTPPPLPGTGPAPKPPTQRRNKPNPPKPTGAPKPAVEAAPKPAPEPRPAAVLPPVQMNLQDILRNALVNIRTDLIPQKPQEEDPTSDWDD